MALPEGNDDPVVVPADGDIQRFLTPDREIIHVCLFTRFMETDSEL
jgi:hypothetical protein